MQYTKLLSNCGKDDVSLVGGKGAALGELIRIGIPVPSGFVITTNAYRIYAKNGIPPQCKLEIQQAFHALQSDMVAVRSSGTMEDSSTASWAGQLESYLNITENHLLPTVLKCWDSFNSTHAQAYQKQSETSHETRSMAMVVQQQICSDISGVCFTANPVSGEKNEIVIEACRGLGELLVQGKITPENYVMRASDGHVVSHTQANQKVMLMITNGQMHELPVSQEKMQVSILSEGERTKIVETAKKIEGHFGKPQDIEWAIEEGNLYIVQSRPITTLS